jgi:GTP-binding protein SAR1
MFLVSWFWSILYSLGLLQKKATILLLGLDNAGKTTLLYKLKHGTIHTFVPTQRAQLEEMVIGNGSIKFRAWDLGGHEAVRHIWRDYYVNADAIVFVVDSADRERVDEAKRELHAVMEEPALQTVPLLILGNKVDLKTSLPGEQLVSALALGNKIDPATSITRRPVALFSCSLVEGYGYGAAFQWLAEYL